MEIARPVALCGTVELTGEFILVNLCGCSLRGGVPGALEEAEGRRGGALFAMFCSEGESIGGASSSSLASVSTGVGRSERGRFPRVGRRGLGNGAVTGVGERAGSFSLEAEASSSSESEGSTLSVCVGRDEEVNFVGCCMLRFAATFMLITSRLGFPLPLSFASLA